MRIAFDLDDTLIPGRLQFAVSQLPAWGLRRWCCREPLRQGAAELINDLWADGHEVWVYTTSFRSPSSVRWMFWGYGTRVARVINQERHQRKMEQLGGDYRHCIKCPSVFGIQLLVDDDPCVVRDSERFGFEVLHLVTDRDDWCDQVRQLACR